MKRAARVWIAAALLASASASASANDDTAAAIATDGSEAAEPIDTAAMQAAMTDYFRGERRGGFVFLAVGAASVGAGVALVGRDDDALRGAAYPALVLGGVQMLVGTIVIFQAGPRIRRFSQQIAEQPGAYRDAESRRVRGIHRTMTILHITELALVGAGVGTAVIAAQKDEDLVAGIAAGVAAEALLLYVQDVFVSRRAKRYGRALTGFQVAVEPRRGRYGLALQMSF